MLLRRLPVFLLLLALGVLPGYSQTAPSRRAHFSIGGNVRDGNDHHAMENIQVVLKSPTGVPVSTAFTRDNGEFQFDGLGNGDYIVEVTVKDYDRAQETVTISGNSRMGLSIFLNRIGKVANPALQLSISAHQLSVPHKAHDEFEKGMTLIYLKSDYRGAIAQFQLAIKDFSTYYEAYAEEGNAYYELQEMGPAEEALRKSIDLSSGQYADAAFTLAALLTDAKRFTEAETIARQGISVDTSSWRGPFELARALTALKETEEAEKSAQQSRDLMPDNPPVYLLLANIHIQRKDYPALVRDLDDYLRLAPTGAEADQARKTRERVQGVLNAPKNETARRGKEKAEDEDDDDADQAPEKASSPAPGPDSSGLPSLPPPTSGNP
jgi:tetratricopeptide (TPR) repeat protein